ncbi:GLUG motif-containing protein [Planctomycetota bacterium]
MTKAGNSQIMRTITLLITIFSLSLPAYAQYSGGTGEPNDPYQIATAEDLMLLGDSPEDYDKHFIMIDDIDLDPNLSGRKVFDRAVIAPDVNDAEDWFQGTSFTGVFDGDGYTISHLVIEGAGYLGLFGHLVSGAEVSNLGIVNVNITGLGEYVGGLVGRNSGRISKCYSSGNINGTGDYVGGLAGINNSRGLDIDRLRLNNINNCYCTGKVAGNDYVGGLVGRNNGNITMSYSTSTITGINRVGGLVGSGYGRDVQQSFWNIQTSGQMTSAGGTGLTTIEMKTASTFIIWGTCGNAGTWSIEDGSDYPRLVWEQSNGEPIMGEETLAELLTGKGTQENPYQIYTGEELELINLFPCDWDKHFKLMADIDLDSNLPGRKVFDRAVIAPDTESTTENRYNPSDGQPFSGVFDGNGHTISHLTIEGDSCLGLFGRLSGEVRDLGVVNVNVTGSGGYVGGLVGDHKFRVVSRGERYKGSITNCYSTGAVSGKDNVGGLTGSNVGNITKCHSTAIVNGTSSVGGLAGANHEGGTIARCYAVCTVQADQTGGGLVGTNYGSPGFRGPAQIAVVSDSYSNVLVNSRVSGLLVGQNGRYTELHNYSGLITNCYAACDNSGVVEASGLVGRNHWLVGEVLNCFWDAQACGVADNTERGTPKTTAEMQIADTFLNAKWDFMEETANGTEDIWWIDEGQDYPRLSWETDNN